MSQIDQNQDADHDRSLELPQPDDAASRKLEESIRVPTEQETFRQVAVGFQDPGAAEADQDLLRPPGRRVREREQRRKEIMDVARHLFAAQGFHGATLDEVARRTEFAKPTLYQYFQNKEHLFYSILEEGLADLNSIVSKALQAAGSAAQQYRTICVMFLIYYRKNMDYFLIQRQFGERLKRQVDNAHHQRVRDQFNRLVEGIEEILERGIRLREFRPVDTVKVTQLFLETLSVYTYAFRESGELRTATEMAEEILGFFFQGIGAASV